MAASRKEYELLMKLTAALGANFGSTFKTAMDTTKKLQDTVQRLNKVQADISAYKKKQDAITANQKSLKELGARHTNLQQELSSTTAREKELEKALVKSEKATGKKTDEYKALQAELKKTQTEKDKLTGQIKANQSATEKATQKIAEEKAELADLTKRLHDAGISTQKLSAENKKLEKVYDRVKKSQENISNINNAIAEQKQAITATKTELIKSVGAIAAAGGAFYAGAIKPAIEFQSAFAGVKKTVDATPEEFAKLEAGIRDLAKALPVAAPEIAAVSEAAGQLGIQTPNILSFTRTMIDLGESTNLSATEAADSLSRFANITGMSQADFNKLGSVIVQLGNNFATTEAEIVDMAMRLAGAGAQVGLNESQIMGLSAALSSVGIESEMGGSAISKTLSSMSVAASTASKLNAILDDTGMSLRDLQMMASHEGKAFGGLAESFGMTKTELNALLKNGVNLDNFAKIAGVTGDEFKTAFEKDAVKALQSFIGGLAGAEEQGESAIEMLQEMGLTEVRLRDTLLRAANASDLFNDSQAMAVLAWEENNALAKEAAQRYETVESLIAIMKNNFSDIALSLGNVFLPHLAEATKYIAELAGKISAFAQENPELIATLAKVAAGLAGMKVAGLGAKLGFQEITQGVNFAKKGLALFQGKLAESAAAAATGGGKIATLGKSLSGYFGGIDTAMSKFDFAKKLMGDFDAGSLGQVIQGHISGAINTATGPLQALGNNITKKLGGIGKDIAAGPLGKIGGVFQNLGKTAGAVLGGPLKGLGSLFGGLFSKVMPIIAIVSLLSMLFVKLNGGDISAFMKPLIDAFNEAKPTLEALKEQFMELGKNLMPLLLDAANKLAPLFFEIAAAILPVLVSLMGALMPIIQMVAETILPVLLQALGEIMPILTELITSVFPILTAIIEKLTPIIATMAKVLADGLAGGITAAIEAIKPVLDNLIAMFKSILSFVNNVFAGNWAGAWEDIKNIFGNAFGALVELVKAPFRVIIGAINGVIGGLNGMKIPDWVPGLGGKGINIPLIPTFSKGTNYTPDTFIAGDINGKGGELVTGARGRKVFTAAETSAIFDNIKAANAFNRTPAAMPQMPITCGGEQSFVIQYSPTIYVDGNTPGDLEEKLRQNNESLLQMFKEFLRQQTDKERRTAYA